MGILLSISGVSINSENMSDCFRQASLDYQKRGFISIMADMSTILGVVLMSIGGIFVLTGMVLCYVTKVSAI